MKAINWDHENNQAVLEKYCKKCEQFYPMHPDYWFRDRRSKDGFRAICKGCYSELPSVLRRKATDGRIR